MAGAERLADEACHIEIDRCRKPIGKQDQYIAAYGGLQYIRFNPDGSVFTDPVICSAATRQKLQTRLLLLYTGLTRSADNILSEQTEQTRSSEEKRASLGHMVSLANQLCEALGRDEIDAFGEILHAGWMEKRKLATNISNGRIDKWYERARANGAIGGKLLGAGGGGFLLFYADPAFHADICRALPELQRVNFNLCPQGSKVIYVEENGYKS
jgi:D-glycero-alpha-D-manno-heptose-7-phosphate kinase